MKLRTGGGHWTGNYQRPFFKWMTIMMRRRKRWRVKIVYSIFALYQDTENIRSV